MNFQAQWSNQLLDIEERVSSVLYSRAHTLTRQVPVDWESGYPVSLKNPSLDEIILRSKQSIA